MSSRRITVPANCYNACRVGRLEPTGGMLSRILTDAQDELLREERRALARLSAALARFDAARDQQEALTHSIEQLDELFLLVVVGEFNAGKSAFINALLGQRILDEGVTPTTTRLGLLRHGPA